MYPTFRNFVFIYILSSRLPDVVIPAARPLGEVKVGATARDIMERTAFENRDMIDARSSSESEADPGV